MAWWRTAANLFSEPESMPFNSRVPEAMQIPTSTTSLARAANAFSYEVVVRSAFTSSYMHIFVTGGAEHGGNTNPAEGHSSLLPAANRGGQQTGEDKKREGRRRTVATLVTGLESMPSTCRVLESMSLKTSTTSLARAVNAFSCEVAVRSACVCPYLRIAVTGGAEQRGHIIPAAGPHLRYFLPKAGQQTGEKRNMSHGALPLRIPSLAWRA